MLLSRLDRASVCARPQDPDPHSHRHRFADPDPDHSNHGEPLCYLQHSHNYGDTQPDCLVYTNIHADARTFVYAVPPIDLNTCSLSYTDSPYDDIHSVRDADYADADLFPYGDDDALQHACAAYLHTHRYAYHSYGYPCHAYGD